jgi:CRISPR/Cas system CSM-associated protein Csm3 (group 7 of RAMP superfamily)
MSRNHFGEEVGPKPYAFVPFSRQIKRRSVPGHERLDMAGHHSGRLAYSLETLTPVFVGTGGYALGEEAGFPQEKVVRPFYRVAGVPAIPGSSLKGVARSIAEAVSSSCVTVTRVGPHKLPKGVERAHSRGNECTATHACPACSIFGRMSQLGKAHFGDAQLVSGGKTQLFRLSPLFAPQAFREPPVYVDEAGKFKGRKFYYHSRSSEDPRQPPVEVVPPGRMLQGQVDFENLTRAELGLLFFALGMDGSIALKLGGGKPLGLGSLRVVAAELTLLGTEHYLRAEADETRYSGQALASFVGETIDAALAEKLLLRDQALALVEILTFTQERYAPGGAY